MIRHIYLIGYRGSGKTSVGKALAALLGWPVFDSDDRVELTAGRSIREIFETEGESGFRALETAAILSLSELSLPHILSLGGGAILRQENKEVIHETGYVVWLKASALNLYSRIHADSATADRRPALTNLAGLDEIKKILAIRSPIYESVSNYSVETDERRTVEIAEDIFRWYSHLQSKESR
ncbi:MAG: shikimate kinase [Planctomycetota bacterium]|nr:shikimate kinase [Planctomycetota bacterium]